MESIPVGIAPALDDDNLTKVTISGVAVEIGEPDYEQFLSDIWVGVVLTLMVLSCVCCMCSCLLYHKFQEWKRGVEARNTATIESGNAEAELPSYTIASGLPSYQEALEQLRKIKELRKPIGNANNTEWMPHTPPTPTLSVVKLFQFYNSRTDPVVNSKPS